ncbi:ras association domain-containing protein 8-like [Chelmon rostratus]|uniref:ras association domain-containing protein 8-like n=1 Tax=Chelmon rostratus TaxID=109905 RepID=UPI001BEC44E5|nr:ras association domain-containing protein 8-like [Chelmon rostratus]XP_041806929.1 ras association domain-containing protein 8-like [Chelmon rostratus]
MELKVWVDGVVRVVCGLSLNTSCQDVVIALAQAIGQTGRYVLILKLRGTERQLVADDCPLHQLAQLGQLAAEVHFVLRRIGPSLSGGPDTPTQERRFPLPRPSEPEPLKRREPQKALTFNLGPSTVPRRTKPSRAWSPSPRASPEPRASPVSFLDPVPAVKSLPSSSSKEEVFRQILQKQRRLQDLEIQLQALERESEVWEQKRSSSTAPSTTVHAEELEELEQRLRQNEAQLMHREHWEEQLQAEMDREQDLQRRLHQIHTSIEDHSYQMKVLQARSAHLEQDLKLRAQRQSSQTDTWQPDEVLKYLKLELDHRLQQGQELDATLSETQRELQAAEDRLQDRSDMTEELNKELRQCKLQQFIQQTSSPHADQTRSLPVTDVYLNNAGIMD